MIKIIIAGIILTYLAKVLKYYFMAIKIKTNGRGIKNLKYQMHNSAWEKIHHN